MNVDPQKARAIFLAAVENHAPDQWGAYLDEACGSDQELRRRVEVLLRAHEQANSLLDPPDAGPAATLDEPLRERPGATIGPYKLLEQIGEGGMGTVFMAEQTEPIRRKVALKIIKAGMDSRQVIARFEAERQALAIMDHPNVAKILDGGATASGRPYFVMDLVKGVPITGYCDEHRLTPRQRLELFIPVCQAVQHAHQKGIIHRDLKPSNVLIALYDGKPVPKVIDFGVAKAAGQQLTDNTLVTGFGAIVGTLEYMSPEQAEINQLDIDTRSDIYSLGVLLYELLAGSPPFSRKELEKAGMLEMLRVIREQEPSKPSMKLSTADGLPTLAANRGTEPAKLTKLVRGELDWIVMKALEKDRNRRYETANGFAMDVQRYLADEAVLACPPSAIYRIRKIARKNRALIGATAMFVALLAAGTAVSVAQAVRARNAERDALASRDREADERTKAEKSEAETRSVLDFVTTRVFAAPRPKGRDGGVAPDVTLRGALEAAMPFIGTNFTHQPLVEARLRETIGISFWNLGEGQQGADQLEAARTLYIQHRGSDHPDTLRCEMALARCCDLLGQNQKSLDLTAHVLEVRKTTLGPDDPATLRTMNNLAAGYVRLHRLDDAVKLYEETLALMDRRLGADHPHTLACRANLASCYITLRRTAEATGLTEVTLRLMIAKIGPTDRDTLTTMAILANCYDQCGKQDDALKLRLEVLALRRANLGVNHPDTLTSIYDLARSYESLDHDAEALPLYQEALALRKAKLGLRHAETLWSTWNVVNLLAKLDRFAEAVPIIDECVRESVGCSAGDHMRPALMDLRLRHFEKLNDAAGCRATAELWDTLQVADAGSFYDAARYRGVAAAVIPQDSKTPAADATRLARAQAELAMAWLRKAVAAGYKDSEHMKQDKDLDALREREDFKKLLAELKAKKK